MQNPFKNGQIPLPPNYATMRNPKNGDIRISKVGFSFTSLIFTILPAAMRSDWYNFLCMIGTEAIVSMGLSVIMKQPLNSVFTFAYYISGIIWGFIYNMMYFRHLQNIGFVPLDKHSKSILIKNKYIKA
ncbi:hypothetical protein WR164_12780 [Philodulcilactobacillus myokoensis]|uniref:DUF2628 domain-containing protein n=1 Tax=Philodulcilactobacillus myokoensis TaxID=2929573 RepID=A0A9W6B1N1_9LACO|nr:hypothetical protein [Philodulcilactobacillus myokoensis]GLB47299.1 hypothetical protein WR164_12780 [Philodulcilactobacillus myokoensis]